MLILILKFTNARVSVHPAHLVSMPTGMFMSLHEDFLVYSKFPRYLDTRI